MTERRAAGRARRPLLAAALLAGLGPQPAWAQSRAAEAAGPRFERIELARHDELLGAWVRELDAQRPGPELVLASAQRLGEQATARHLTLYRWTAAGALESWRELAVPDDVVAFAVGDALGRGAPQLLYFTPSSVFALERAGEGAPARIAEHRFFATAPAPGALPLWDGVRDLDGDGRAELLLPDTRGYAIYRAGPAGPAGAQGKGALQLASHIEAGSAYSNEPSSRRARRIRSEGRVRQTRALNQLLPAALDGDALLDLVALDGEELLGFAQRPGLSFAAKPSARRRLSGSGRSGSQVQLRTSPGGGRSTLVHGDVDGDGLTDFLLPEVDSGELVTRLRLFLAGPDGLPAQPSQILKLSSLGGEPELIDINGDGRLDLGCASVRTDRLRAGGAPQRLDFTYYAFLFQAGTRLFSGSPDLSWDVSVELREPPRREQRDGGSDDGKGDREGGARTESDEESASDVAERSAPQRAGRLSMAGDFDGDGTRDLARLSETGELSVFPLAAAGEGRMRLSVAEEPLLRAQEKPARELRIEDASGDGRADALLLYPGSLLLLVSRP